MVVVLTRESKTYSGAWPRVVPSYRRLVFVTP